MDAALEALQECMQRHPHDVAVYPADPAGPPAAIATGDLKRAEAFLQDNLNGKQTPASKEWRDSLFALGDLLHLAGPDAEAIPPSKRHCSVTPVPRRRFPPDTCSPAARGGWH